MLYYIFVLIVNFARYILMVTFPESLLRKTEGTLAGTGIMRQDVEVNRNFKKQMAKQPKQERAMLKTSLYNILYYLE